MRDAVIRNDTKTNFDAETCEELFRLKLKNFLPALHKHFLPFHGSDIGFDYGEDRKQMLLFY